MRRNNEGTSPYCLAMCSMRTSILSSSNFIERCKSTANRQNAKGKEIKTYKHSKTDMSNGQIFQKQKQTIQIYSILFFFLRLIQNESGVERKVHGGTRIGGDFLKHRFR